MSRSEPVHVQNPDVTFPSPAEISGQMEQYCRSFPAFITPMLYTNNPIARDAVLNAAKASHSFVNIHPYIDGNGHISRLLMNLVLSQHFPPVPIKANSKGRKRYKRALKSGDLGNLEPLACLVALSLNNVYDRLLIELEPGEGT